ncbi:MAG: recombination protein RecR, recombination protein RecR [Candidatus Parcubacteria bacterium]|jgi:recombination protein RecR
MDTIEHLAALFQKFPGIGPRQAQRFVQFLLRAPSSTRRELAELIRELGGSVRQCEQCNRFHVGAKKSCSICLDASRDHASLAIVASDADLTALERSDTFRGRYFVLGGLISLASEKMDGVRLKQLFDSIPNRIKNGLQEVILAFPANPEGDATASRVHDDIIAKFPGFKVTSLGRGLSTGSELEYADPETLKNAFASRR